MRIKKPNAVMQLNSDPEYARKVIADLRDQGLTAEQIAIRAGIHIRSVYRVQHTGFTKFPMQHILECMAGLRHG